ncbi:MAG: ComEC/Rec2 family competence protein [Patescibacteria group bacterium]
MEGQLIPAQILRRGLIGLLAGIVAGYFLYLSWLTAAFISLLFSIAIFLIKDQRRWWLLALIFLTLGLARSASEQPQRPPDIPNQTKVEFSGWISEAPLLEESRARYVVTVEDKNWQRVLVSARRYPVYQYGDRLKVNCELEQQVFSYWVERNVYSACSFPQLVLLDTKAGSTLKRGLYQLRSELSIHLSQMLPEPHSSLIAGIIWGEQAGLPYDLKQAFKRTGTTHILAVSGYNVTTITAILFTLLVAVGLKRKSASLFLLILIVAFVIFTGAEASVIRAGIMGGLVVVARLFGRASKPLNIVLLAAASMLLVWPRLLIDLGFQLSFVAMLGLLYLAPVMQKIFKPLPEVLNLRQVIAETLSASLATLPLLLIRISSLSIVSPLANVLIVPVIPWAMMGGLVLIPISFLGAGISFLAWPLWLLLSYVQIIVFALADISWSYIEASWWLWLVVAAIYILLGRWFIKTKEKTT